MISARRAATTKVIAPDDLRIHKLERIDLEHSTSDEATVYGDGTWAHYSRESTGKDQTIAQSQRSGEFLKWFAIFHPRRSHLLVPGVLVLVPSLILWTYWLTAGVVEGPELRNRQHTVRRRRQEAIVRLPSSVLYREHTTLVLPKPRAFTFIQFCHSMAILGASHKHVSNLGISIPP